LEVFGFAEIAVDAGEADIGDGVDFLEGFHHQFADVAGSDVGLAAGFELADDAVDDALDALVLDRAFAERDADGAGEFVAIEGDAAGIGFEDDEFAELDAFDGGEALAAGGAEAAAADGAAVLGWAGVFHLRVEFAAEGTAHLSKHFFFCKKRSKKTPGRGGWGGTAAIKSAGLRT